MLHDVLPGIGCICSCIVVTDLGALGYHVGIICTITMITNLIIHVGTIQTFQVTKKAKSITSSSFGRSLSADGKVRYGQWV